MQEPCWTTVSPRGEVWPRTEIPAITAFAIVLGAAGHVRQLGCGCKHVDKQFRDLGTQVHTGMGFPFISFPFQGGEALHIPPLVWQA